VRALVALVLPEGSIPWRAITLHGLMLVTMAESGLGFNSPEVHQLQLPAANGITNARSLARVYAATIGEVDGIRLPQPETVAAALVIRSEGKPWGEPFEWPTWGTGFLRPFPRQPILGGASCGHDGAGGSIAFAEPELGLAFCHVFNLMVGTPEEDRRTAALLAAVRQSDDSLSGVSAWVGLIDERRAALQCGEREPRRRAVPLSHGSNLV
jgi:hypothetical protein